MVDRAAAAAAVNARVGGARPRVDASTMTGANMNDFIAGRSLAPEPDPELDALLALKSSDLVAYYSLPLDVRARCDAYARDVALAEQADPGTGA
jgi:hypothetical protein